MVTSLWTTFLALLLLVSCFPNDSRALHTVNSPRKIWSLSPRPIVPTVRNQLGQNVRLFGGNNGLQIHVPVPVVVVPWNQWRTTLWSSRYRDNDGVDHSLTVDHKNRFWQHWKRYFPSTRNDWKSLFTYWIPPIPAQDVTRIRHWYQHFNPRFVMRETILGIRIMMRIYCLLALFGYIFEACYPLFPSLAPTSLETFPDQSPLHIMEGLVKHLLLERLPSMPIVLRLTIVGPIFEEMAYRGIGFMGIYWGMWWYLYLWSFLVGISPLLGGLWIGHHWYHTLVYQVPNVLSKGPSLLELVKTGWLDWIPQCLLLPLQIRMLRLATASNVKKQQPIDTFPAVISSSSSSPSSPNDISKADAATKKPMAVPPTHRHERMIQRILHSRKLLIGKDSHGTDREPSELETTTASVVLSHQIQMVLLFITRWKTSSLFAAAHLPFKAAVAVTAAVAAAATTITTSVGGDNGSWCPWMTRHNAVATMMMHMISSKDQYLYLRKFWGVFASSFWVESRLVSQRATLWGAMGAHVCFNTLTIYRVLLEVWLVETWGKTTTTTTTTTIGMMPLLVLLLFIPGQWVLDWMGMKLEQVENRLMMEGGIAL